MLALGTLVGALMASLPLDARAAAGGVVPRLLLLPIVVHSAESPEYVRGGLADMLSAARDRGVRKAGELAVEHGPAHGWPLALAQQYLERYLSFGLTDKHAEGMVRFFDRATAGGLARGNERSPRGVRSNHCRLAAPRAQASRRSRSLS